MFRHGGPNSSYSRPRPLRTGGQFTTSFPITMLVRTCLFQCYEPFCSLGVFVRHWFDCFVRTVRGPIPTRPTIHFKNKPIKNFNNSIRFKIIDIRMLSVDLFWSLFFILEQLCTLQLSRPRTPLIRPYDRTTVRPYDRTYVRTYVRTTGEFMFQLFLKRRDLHRLSRCSNIERSDSSPQDQNLTYIKLLLNFN